MNVGDLCFVWNGVADRCEPGGWDMGIVVKKKYHNRSRIWKIQVLWCDGLFTNEWIPENLAAPPDEVQRYLKGG